MPDEKPSDQLRRQHEHKADIRRFAQGLRPGREVRISYRAVVAENQPADGRHLLVYRDGELWQEQGPADVVLIHPDVVMGCQLRANGVAWVVRRSNRRDSLRVMPVDLSSRNRTLPIEVFFTRYPAAVIMYDPREETK